MHFLSIVPNLMFRINNDYFNIFIKNDKKTDYLDLRKKAFTSISFIIGNFTLKPKLSEFYAFCVNMFTLCY